MDESGGPTATLVIELATETEEWGHLASMSIPEVTQSCTPHHFPPTTSNTKLSHFLLAARFYPPPSPLTYHAHICTLYPEDRTVRSSEMVSCQNTTWHDNPKDLDLNLHCHENFKFHITQSVRMAYAFLRKSEVYFWHVPCTAVTDACTSCVEDCTLRDMWLYVKLLTRLEYLMNLWKTSFKGTLVSKTWHPDVCQNSWIARTSCEAHLQC
jgi:hypothetical protein